MARITAAQYKNLSTLYRYLHSVLGTHIANCYDHRSYNTCTLGMVAKSGLLPHIPVVHEIAADGSWMTKRVGAGQSVNYSTIVEVNFGKDFFNDIAAGETGVEKFSRGEEQVKEVIRRMENLFVEHDYLIPSVKPVKAPKKAPPPNPATAGKRIEARIARMEKVKADIAKLGVDAKHFTVNVQSMDAQIAALRDALAS